jgi:hypothetical protein
MAANDREAIFFDGPLGVVGWRDVERNVGPTDPVGRSNITTIAVAAQFAGGFAQMRITNPGHIVAIQTI